MRPGGEFRVKTSDLRSRTTEVFDLSSFLGPEVHRLGCWFGRGGEDQESWSMCEVKKVGFRGWSRVLHVLTGSMVWMLFPDSSSHVREERPWNAPWWIVQS